MQLSYTKPQMALRSELREYFTKLMSPAVQEQLERDGLDSAIALSLRKQLGSDGWLGVGWPIEYGGRGLTPVEQFIFRDVAEQAGAPLPFLALDTVGPTLMRFGTPEQKRRILSRILTGDLEFAVGYTEPEAGSDLAALRTRASRAGDEYVINGSKIFTTYAHVATYIWLAARTGPPDSRHHGISIFLVPTTTPGITITPLDTLVGDPTTTTFYDDVHVSADSLVLGENEGWRVITAQLNNERIGVGGFASRTIALLADVIRWAETYSLGGRRVIDIPWVQLTIARAHAKLEAVRLQNLRAACAAQAGTLTTAQASLVKVLSSEVVQDATAWMLEILGQAGHLCAGSPGAQLRGRVEHSYRAIKFYTFGGGTNELQRELIAWQGLGLPRGTR